MIYQQCSPQAHTHTNTLAYTVEAGHKLSVYLDSAKSKGRAEDGAAASEFQLLLDFMHAKLVHNKFAAAPVVLLLLLLLCLGTMDTLTNVLQCANES